MSQQITIPSRGDILAERYRILDELGRGSYGIVFKAERVDDDLVVAIKTLLPQSILDREVIDRFTREAQLVSRLDHPSIISLYDYGQRDNLFYMVVEYVEGRSLADLLKEDAPLAPDAAGAIIEQVLDALKHAHAQGIVHRDLKPDNILLAREEDGSEFVKILDFGIAKLVRNKSDNFKTLTQAGHVLGTPHYMSPEQISGDEVVAATDLYSVGIILYELLVGEHPFEGTTSTSVMVAHLHDDPPALPAALEQSKWGEAVRRALVKQPYDRLESATAFLEILHSEDDATLMWSSDEVQPADLAPTREYQPLTDPHPVIDEERAPSAPPSNFGSEPASPADDTQEPTRQWSRNDDELAEVLSASSNTTAAPPVDTPSAPAAVAQETSSSTPTLLIAATLVLICLFSALAWYAFTVDDSQTTPANVQTQPNPTVATQEEPRVQEDDPSSPTETSTPTPTTDDAPEAGALGEAGETTRRNDDEEKPAPESDTPAPEKIAEATEAPPEDVEDPASQTKSRPAVKRTPKKEDPPATITLTIQSRPAGANVFVENKLRGKTPLEVETPRGRLPVKIRIESIGYKTSTRHVRPNRDRTEMFRLNKTLLGP